MRQSFIARNRIIAALADVILIPEAAERSGGLHTAGFGLDLGRTICAVPGSILSPTSTGTNRLIKTGAVLTQTSQDILEALGHKIADTARQLRFAGSEEELVILGLLNSGPVSGYMLQSGSGLETKTFSQTLTMLEITGRIKSLGNHHWSLSWLRSCLTTNFVERTIALASFWEIFQEVAELLFLVSGLKSCLLVNEGKYKVVEVTRLFRSCLCYFKTDVLEINEWALRSMVLQKFVANGCWEAYSFGRHKTCRAFGPPFGMWATSSPSSWCGNGWSSFD